MQVDSRVRYDVPAEVAFAGRGEMRARCRAFDWPATPLGPVDGWPPSLRASVQLVLAHPLPALLLCGPDLIQIYNDSCRAMMGARHPAGLGQSMRDCFPAAWEVNAPVWDRVWRGEGVSLDNTLFPFDHPEMIDDAPFTHAYAPVYDDDGCVNGVLITIVERARADVGQGESEIRYRTGVERLVIERTAERDRLRLRLAEAEEAERRRLSRELHDQLGQQLTAIALGADDALRRASDERVPIDVHAPLVSRLSELRSLAHDVQGRIRYVAHELRPAELDVMGLESALDRYVREWSARYGIAVEFAFIRTDDRAASWIVDSTLYRIAQEALTNVAKHARAAEVSVIVEQAGDESRLIVEDDGLGFDVQSTRDRVRNEHQLGLAGMQERAALVGGSITIESSPNHGGTTLFVRLPATSV